MNLLPLVFSNGWASGVNAYLVVLVLGIMDRLGSYSEIPDALGRWEVLTAAGILYGIEFVADKIPYVDSVWDAVSTAIRPTVGAALGLLVTGDATTLHQAVAAAIGGGTALLSHLVKAGIRAGVNTSPEPVSNIGVSVAEDVTVAGVVVLAIFHPWAALTVALVLLVAGTVLVVAVLRTVRGVLRRRTPAVGSGARHG